MEFPEDPRNDSRSPDAHSPRAEDVEAEAWLRRELAFLYGVERRIRRRDRLRREAWRAAAVALILAVFACCWYLAALSADGATRNACPAKNATTSSGSAASGSAATGSAATGDSAAHAQTGTVGATASRCTA